MTDTDQRDGQMASNEIVEIVKTKVETDGNRITAFIWFSDGLCIDLSLQHPLYEHQYAAQAAPRINAVF